LINYSQGISFTEALNFPVGLRKYLFKEAEKLYKIKLENFKVLAKVSSGAATLK